MKYICIIFAAISLALAVWIFNLLGVQQDDLKQHEDDVGQVGNFSNQWISVQQQVAERDSSLLAVSNRLDESRAALSSLSNQLDTAQAAINAGREQVADLNRSVAKVESENQGLGRYIGQLTNQITALVAEIQVANTNIARMANEYSLLENRLRRDVAERVVVERNFSNYAILQMQVQKLMTNGPTPIVSPRDIYAGLNVEVDENGEAHVISPTVPPETAGKL